MRYYERFRLKREGNKEEEEKREETVGVARSPHDIATDPKQKGYLYNACHDGWLESTTEKMKRTKEESPRRKIKSAIKSCQ